VSAYNKAVHILFFVLIFILVFTIGIPPSGVMAKPVPDLEVDVWTDKGGQGLNMPGGQYSLGETPVIFFKVNIGCNVRITLAGDGTNTWHQQAMYGPVYQITLGVAEKSDIGQWQVLAEASTTTGDQFATDTTSFSVVGSSPAPVPPATPVSPAPPTTTPAPLEQHAAPSQPSTSPSEAATQELPPAASVPDIADRKPVSIRPDTATGLHALAVMNMFNGSIPADLDLDATGDGMITDEDARMILRWSLKSPPALSTSFDPDNIQIIGQDKDGTPDRLTYTFPRQEVARDLYLDKSIDMGKASSGYKKQITLTFENESDTPVEYRHVEEIPKSFAAHVDDLQFSPPPDEIIDSDPSVAFLLILGAIGAATLSVVGLSNMAENPLMSVTRFEGMDPEQQCIFMRQRIETYLPEIRSSASRYNIPPDLVATVILNELIDYDITDQLQETIANTGSSGMAQINVNTAIRHNLVDVNEEEIAKKLRSMGIDGKFTPVPGVDVQSQSSAGPSESDWFHSEYLELQRKLAIEHIVWEKLNQPELAIEAAAREIDYALKNMNRNLDKSWQQYFLSGPIDRENIYANLNIPLPREKDPEKKLLMQKQALAFLVAAAYNTETIVTSDFAVGKPYSGRDKGKSFYNAINHGNNACNHVVEALKHCGLFEEGFVLTEGQFIEGSGSYEIKSDNLGEFINMYLREILPQITMNISPDGTIGASQTVPVNIDSGQAQFSGNANVEIEGTYTDGRYSGTFYIDAQTTALQNGKSFPMDLQYEGQFSSAEMPSYDEIYTVDPAVPIRMSFIGPVRSEDFYRLLAESMHALGEAFNELFGSDWDDTPPEDLPDTLSKSYTSEVDYYIRTQ
jgi:hypothetical protein